MSSTLPPGPLLGYYASAGQLHLVYHGSPNVVLHTPTLRDAPEINTSEKIPRFREPRFLSFPYAYLAFVPKHRPWNSPLFKTLDRPRHKLPIILDGPEGYCLERGIADDWLNLEICLRTVGMEMFRIAPQRWLAKIVSPWFYPGRFKFLRHFPTEEAARFAAWYSAENFLPLVGYVSMGLWCMLCWEGDMAQANAADPNWRQLVIEKTGVHPAFLEWLERSVVGDWSVERVGALYHIQSPDVFTPTEREQRAEFEEIFTRFISTKTPIPLYFYWGDLRPRIDEMDVPKTLRNLIPTPAELQRLFSKRGEFSFIRCLVDDKGAWAAAAEAPVASAPAPVAMSSESAPPAPFPSRPPNSEQRNNETIRDFFERRAAANLKRVQNENKQDRQRREQRLQSAKRQGISKGASVFIWELEDGHYIRHPVARAEVEDVVVDFHGPRRRFDPIRNQWDLCEVFQSRDLIFGEWFPTKEEEDDDDDMDDYPKISLNIDPASTFPDEPQEQHPPETDTAVDYVPTDEDFGPEFTQSELPTRDLTDASKKCVEVVYVRFGLTPRTEEPVYESIATTLLAALKKRFGFRMPLDNANFTPRDVPTKTVSSTKDMEFIIGMYNLGSAFALHPGLERVLGIFFGQCLTARSYRNVDRALQQPPPQHPHLDWFWEKLKSMRHPSQVACYYGLRRRGAGVQYGSDVLLLTSATDLLEVLRQGWGPELRDVVEHLIARGIPFWHACVSGQIMPESTTAIDPGNRPKGFQPDTTSGVGFRPAMYLFTADDYNAYTTVRDIKLLHTPRARIALQYGGALARLARSEVADEDFFRQFDDEIYDVGDCLWDGHAQHAYWHYALVEHEIDLLCGLYSVATGSGAQVVTVSWWPKPNAWARGGLCTWWMPQSEDDFYQRRLKQFERSFYTLNNQTDWRHNLKYRNTAKKFWEGYENVAESILKDSFTLQ
ncbi:hypothetical protein C8R46DRAFT_1221973 [Mycena filopes]|nr:hypothetical protein C8R46DRAFT_1221973 [Mycena filopes]